MRLFAKARKLFHFRERAGISSQPTSVNLAPPQQSATITAPTPWQAYTIDQKTLADVYAWNTAHPGNTLLGVAQKVFDSVEEHDVLLELIPDGLVPIRGLIKAVAHVVKLGINIVEAKAEALQYAENVFRWVEKLADVFQDHNGGGDGMSKTWKDLADIMKSIDDVCSWANKMLMDKVGLKDRAAVKEKILDFEKQFTKNIEHFEVFSQIRTAQQLDVLVQGQDKLVQMLLPQADKLDATYQFQKKIPCDPGTRKLILEEIMTWITDISVGSPCFFWLSGDPGVGKSAVTASIAQECKGRKILWAQFFINRNDASTTDPQLYFPTIVKQMSERKPAVGYAVQNILKEQPDLLKDDISVQASELFLKAVQAASESTPQEPIAIVIDALDETDLKRLKATAVVFSRILVDLPSNVKVFVSSRVENVIRDNFNPHPRARNIHLSARTSVADVTQFLETKVDEIMTEFHIDHSHWGHERMRKLCSQAAGLFIWAVTAIAYLRSQIEDFGTERLNVVLDELNTHGMDNINVLYMAILKRTYQREASSWQTQCFQRIMGGILAQQSPLSIKDLKGLLDLQNPTIGTPVDIEHFVRRLRTVLVPGVGEINSQTIPRVHKSFVDFITSADAQEFRVDMVASHGELALRCIDQLIRLWKFEDKLPGQLRYATSHWSSHLTHVVGVPVEQDEADTDEKSINDEENLLLKSNAEQDAGASISLDSDPTLPLAHSAGGHTHGISISPDGSCICYARGQSVLLRDIETGNFIGAPLNGHTDIVRSATFSPDGRYIASASDDKTICIWDTETATPVGDPLSGHTKWVSGATFSPDGRQIVSSSADNTVCVWDVETHHMLRSIENHTNTVYSAFFSPDARLIVSSSADKAIQILNISMGKNSELSVLEAHCDLVRSAFFSPDGKNILSYSVDGTVIISSVTGGEISEYFTSSGSTNATLAFTHSESIPYIETPPTPLVSTKDQDAQQSYILRVGTDGIAVEHQMDGYMQTRSTSLQ